VRSSQNHFESWPGLDGSERSVNTMPSPDSVSPYVLLGMTAGTGIVDAVSVLALGHVFTANMTGNVVFLGFALAGEPRFSIIRSSLALTFFLLGAVMGGRLLTRMSSRPIYYSAGWAFGLDGLLLMAAGLVLFLSLNTASETALFGVIALTALAMGLRNATARRLGAADLTTTVLTMTITGLAADSSLAGGDNPRWQRRVASIFLMFAGAFTGALVVRKSAAYPLLLCGLGSIACALMVLRQGPRSRGDSQSTSSTD
jgi:uncharacterized membrane protein YoaK (UPF0700 family)